MISKVKLYNIQNGIIDYNGEHFTRSIVPSIFNSKIPERLDIFCNHLIIHYEGNEHSYARVYTYEKVYPAKRVNNNKKEDIENNAYLISFNNPHDNEKPLKRIICLSNSQNIVFTFYRFIRWLRVKENLLWLTNIILLILNIIALMKHGS